MAAASAGAPAQTQGINMKVAVPAVVIAVIAVAVALVFVLLPHGGTPLSPKSQGSRISAVSTPSIEVGGKKITALQRPTVLASLQAGSIEEGGSGSGATGVSGAEGSGSGTSGATGTAGTESTVEAHVSDYAVDSDLGNVMYVQDTLSGNDQMKALLAKDGFGIQENNFYDEFFEQYEHNRYTVLPSFVTTDSMMHTYHLYFAHLLKNTEREQLSDRLAELSSAMLSQSVRQYDQLSGTEWEDAARRNVGFFAVGASLLNDSTVVPDPVTQAVSAELNLVKGANGIAQSPLFGADVDYSQYQVRGYYEGDAVLEPYFRAMMWYGQMNFTQSKEDLDRSALLMTLALHESGLAQWESIYAVTSFFAGASDDCGYYEYYPLFVEAYGEDATAADLAGNDEAWGRYHSMTEQMPAPQINSVVVDDEGEGADHEEDEKGFRFMGQRFSVDAAILQQLIYSNVGENAQGVKRMLPNALDVPAALGSDEAYSILQEEGETAYHGYDEHMAELRQKFSDAPADTWNASLYSRWLYTLDPLLAEKDAGWPKFMQSSDWTRKNLQTYLGSYTELKHDTVLYSKQVMAEAGGFVERTDDRGYVEPEPELYARLSQLVGATADGLVGFGMLDSTASQDLAKLRELANQLQVISEKELREEALTDDEYELIRSYGVQLEHFWQEAYQGEPVSGSELTTKDYPAPLVADIATGDSQVLELGTGKPTTIYVVVPVDGSLRIAIGSVFSFYQFDWPASDRLTDTKWRDMMGFTTNMGTSNTSKPDIATEDWTRSFQLVSRY